MNCIKLLGQSLMARDFDRQVAEIQIRIAVTATPLLAHPLQSQQDESVRGEGKFAVQPICACMDAPLV